METIIIIILGILLLGGYGLVRFITGLVKGRRFTASNEKSNLLALSKEDAVSQLLIVVGISFFGLSLYNIFINFGIRVSWEWILLICSSTALLLGHFKKLLYASAVGAISLPIWIAAQYGTWASSSHIQVIVVLSMFSILHLAYYLAGAVYSSDSKWKRFSVLFTGLGFIGVVFIMLGLSTSGGLRAFQEMLTGNTFYTSWKFVVMLVLVSMMFFALLYKAYKDKVSSILEVAAMICLFIFFTSLSFAPALNLFDNQEGYYSTTFNSLSSIGIGWTLLFNILTFFLMLGIVYSGYIKNQPWRINTGAALLFLYIIFKYFDWFYTFLNKSLFFLIAGLLMLGLGFALERGRKIVISTAKASDGGLQ